MPQFMPDREAPAWTRRLGIDQDLSEIPLRRGDESTLKAVELLLADPRDVERQRDAIYGHRTGSLAELAMDRGGKAFGIAPDIIKRHAIKTQVELSLDDALPAA